MAGDHMRVLAAQIYNDQNIVFPFPDDLTKVTYRLLSRLIGVHVNLAKQYINSIRLIQNAS
jgi:hypothetical protein